ncbi:calcium-dependent protein kinase 26 [Tanacetum coccineum]
MTVGSFKIKERTSEAMTMLAHTERQAPLPASTTMTENASANRKRDTEDDELKPGVDKNAVVTSIKFGSDGDLVVTGYADKVIAESLSEEEIAVLKEMFKAMDTDNNGAVTCDELKAGLRKFGSTLKDTEIRDLMDAADVDNSGTIDYGKFVAATIHLNKLDREEHLVAAFYIDKMELEVDQDNDGRIDYGEFVAMMTIGNAGVGRWTMRNSVNISMRDSPRARDSPGAL